MRPISDGNLERPGADARWTPARLFLAASAAYHLILGAAGIAIDRSFPLTARAAEGGNAHLIFGVFQTNGWHSVAAIALGLLSLAFALRPAGARSVAMVIGVSQAAVVLSFAVTEPSTFLFASNGADQVVHAITAIGGVIAALLSPREHGRYVGAARA